MNSDPNHDDSHSPDGDFDWAEAQGSLDELRRVTHGTDQHELHQFVCLLCQLVDLRQRGLIDESTQQETGVFVATSLEEIRLVVADEQRSSERLDSLRHQAVDRWGDRLSPLEEQELETDQWDSREEVPSDSDDNDLLAAPTAEQINSLLSSLGPLSTVADHATADDSDAENHEADSGIQPGEESIWNLDPELREAFLDDARACIGSMEDALLRLDSDPSHGDSLNQICRDLHTLKGASASVGLTSMADQLHVLEDGLRDNQSDDKSALIDDLLEAVDSIRNQMSTSTTAALPQEPEAGVPQEPSVKPSVHAKQFDSFSEGPDDDESVRVKSSQLNRLMDMLAELVMLRNRRETEVSQLKDVYHELTGSVSKMRLLSNEDYEHDSVCSSLQLSEIANDVLEVAHSIRDCARPVAEGNAAVSQFIRQFRQELVELRRTPISGLFQRLQRAVRDAARAESKDVRLQLVGEQAGIERSLQQRLYEPLLHIVRNSVCHGIEKADERSNAGKDPTGTITLEAKSTADLFVIEIRDDGRGLDYDAIRRRGIESGLISADQAVSRNELSQLIFHPGFSTRQTANQVAGRGVGMDVVASTLRRMRGWLEVDSETNAGTRIRLSFPLPSVIQHAMIFRSAGQLFALPMQSVKNAGEVERGSMLLEFARLIGPPNRVRKTPDTLERIVLAHRSFDAADTSGVGEHVTLMVDEIVGPEEVVVRPLPPLLRNHPFSSGASLSGMGETVLLLDARRIIESSRQHLRKEQRLTEAESQRRNQRRPRRPHVLVVDDSLSARKRVVRSLHRYPFDVTEASDGKQALALLNSDRFDAIFTDMEMPHVSGMELLAQVNSGSRDYSPPVVIISSRGEDEFTERAKELGVSGYLAKPLADEALDSALSVIPSLQQVISQPSTQIPTSGDIR